MQYIIVTGASRGLGAAIVRRGIDDAATIFAISRTASDELIELAAQRGVSLRWFTTDLSDPGEIDDVFPFIARMVAEETPSSITLVANAARLEPIGLVGALETAAIDQAVRLNVTAVIATVQRFVAHFGTVPVEKHVIAISSGAAQRAMPGLSVYSASKAAVNAFVRSAQAEWDHAHPDGRLRFLAVSPGLVDTEMQATLRESTEAALPERGIYREWHAAGKLVSPDEAARTILSLRNRSDIEAGSYVHIGDLS